MRLSVFCVALAAGAVTPLTGGVSQAQAGPRRCSWYYRAYYAPAPAPTYGAAGQTETRAPYFAPDSSVAAPTGVTGSTRGNGPSPAPARFYNPYQGLYSPPGPPGFEYGYPP
jgi:hypothetical protein